VHLVGLSDVYIVWFYAFLFPLKVEMLYGQTASIITFCVHFDMTDHVSCTTIIINVATYHTVFSTER